MSSRKISQYDALTNVQADDLLVVVDVHDTSMAASGTTKKMTLSQLPAPSQADFAPTGLTGATAATRYVGGTVSGAPASGTFAVGDFVIDQAGKVWICTTAGTPGTWTQAGVTLPLTTLGDTLYEDATPALARLPGNTTTTRKFLAQTGTGSASAVPAWGTLAASDISAAYPWQFRVTDPAYGAVGNGKVVTDGAITSGQATLTSATAGFTSADTGKSFIVNGAGAVAGESLVATGTFVNSTTMTLSVTAGQTVTGATVSYGSDDTAAFQAAINAAVTYAQAHSLYAEVIVPPASSMFYMIAGPLVTGGTTHGNAQITLPVIATSSGKVTLVIKGVSTAAPLAHWQQQAPLLAGANLISTGVFSGATPQSNSINANGNPCIIGGPAQPAGYGTTGTLYSNMCVVLDGLRLIVPLSQNGYAYCGFDFSGVAAAGLRNGGCDSTATYQSEWQAHNMGAAGFNFGGLMPANSNNDYCPVEDWTIGGGYVYGMMLTEHCCAERMRVLYCWTALGVSGSYWSSTGVHAVHIGQLSTEGCANTLKIFGAGSGGVGPYIDIGQLDWEGASTLNLIDDGSSGLADARGTIKVTGGVPTGVNVNGSAMSASNQTGLKIIFASNQPGVWGSPPAVPASGTAQVNTSFHDAWVNVQPNGATISAIAVDSTTLTGITSGWVFVPSGHSIKLTYTVATPAWQWILI